jgi:hypothetical protein
MSWRNLENGAARITPAAPLRPRPTSNNLANRQAIVDVIVANLTSRVFICWLRKFAVENWAGELRQRLEGNCE